ncbi:peptidoglycan -binding protein [Thalassococcus sp. BH17M4-6]|uniref:peptidoglycan -binding protein n=1 Tax=Thalassococcus sp. BH17M4-6 TaxID=3413148 RepID=UPI003BD129B5
MALSRRTGQRFQSSIWPGFVDAMTGLLLVLMFVLTIFMVVQFVLRETISGQENQLNNLSGEIAALAQALGLEQRRNTALSNELGALSATLEDRNARLDEQDNIIAALSATRDRQAAELEAAAGRIASFEEQVAGLLSERDDARTRVSDLEAAQAELLDEREALNLALASARDEVDAQAEAARLAAARREALEALTADLRAQNADASDRVTALSAEVDELTAALSEEEAQRLAEAEAAAALRARLENADAELTAMTLSLEAERARAEETLTLLAAARAAEDDLNAQLAAALLDGAEEADALRARLDAADAALAEAQAARDKETGALQDELASVRAELAQATERLSRAEGAASELTSLQARLAEALLRAEEAQALETRVAALREENAALSEDAGDQTARIADLRAQLAEAEAQLSAQDGDNRSLEERLAAALAAKLEVEASAEETREKLTAALAAQRAADRRADQALTQSETRAALLATAHAELETQRSRASDATLQTEALTRQLAQVRRQLDALQGLLDESRQNDASAQVRVQTLTADLNAAIARVASEERKRRLLEEELRRKAEAENQDLQRYRSEFFGRLRDVLGTQEGVRIEGDRFVFSSEVLFPPGEAELSALGRREVAKVADILQGVADDIPDGIDWVIRVDGHTDDVPIRPGAQFADNWELSQARALSVVKYMIDGLGIAPGRLAANGFGQYQPVNPDDTAEARAQNRRIELKFTEK